MKPQWSKTEKGSILSQGGVYFEEAKPRGGVGGDDRKTAGDWEEERTQRGRRESFFLRRRGEREAESSSAKIECTE